MGQKVHPEGLRVGYIHDWKSNWFNEKNFSDYLHEDTLIRRHIVGRLSHAGLSNITIRKNATEVEINIHTARPGIVIGKSGSEVDQLRRDALGRQGREGPGLGPARRRRDGADGGLLRRPRPAAHASRGHRLRLPR